MTLSRRRLLRAGAVAAAGGLAGCLSGSSSPGGGSGSDGPTATADGSATGGDGTPTGGTDGTTADRDRLTLPTLDVRESPGDPVVVKPPGTVALLDFFATWCAPCKPQMSHLREVHQRFSDVHMLSITSERDEEAIRSFWREYEGTWPVAQDTDLTATTRYSATQMPTMIVLDADGTEVWRHVGLAAADSVAEQLRTAGASQR